MIFANLYMLRFEDLIQILVQMVMPFSRGLETVVWGGDGRICFLEEKEE